VSAPIDAMAAGVAGLPRRAGWGHEILATLALAWPLVIANIAGTALTTIDVILLGRLSAEALAASALGANLFVAVMLTGTGVVTAVSPMIATEYGRRRYGIREIRRTVRQGLWAACAIAVPGWLILWQGEAILKAFGQDPALAAMAGAYLRAMQWALLPMLAFTILRLFTAALGRPGWSLAISLAGLPVNLLLAWLLVFGHAGLPAFGIVGAGIATTLTALLGFAGMAAVVLSDRRFRRYHAFGRFWRADWARFRAIFRLGVPIGATLAFEVALFGATGLAMGWIGVDSLAGHTIALQITALCFMVPLGLAQAATIRVGRAQGAGSPAGVTMAGWSAFGLAMAFETMTAAMLLAIPGTLVRLFLEVELPGNAAVYAKAVAFLGIAALFQLADGAQVVGSGMLRGLKDTRRPMIYAAIGYWGIGAPLGLLLAFPLGLAGLGLWIGLAIGLAAVSALLLHRWQTRDRLRL
jgi:MATE family multidrug resistance protein